MTDGGIGTSRRVRWLIIAAPVVMAGVLAAAALHSWGTTNAAMETLTRGQGEVLTQAVRSALHGGRRDAATRLTRVLSEYEERGLRCVAVFGPESDLQAQAGCRESAPALLSALRSLGPGGMVQRDGLVRIAEVPPGPRARVEGPPGFEAPPGAEPPGPPGTGPRRGRGPGPRALLIEFEPLEAETLRQDANLSLGIALGGALALLGAAFFVGRLLRRAEQTRAVEARQRRLASLGEMSAVLAHEIRNPLASLKGHAQLLAEQLDPGGRPHKKAERVVHEATRLEKLTTDLLDFVRTEQLQRGRVTPAEVLRAAIEASGAGDVAVEVAEAPPGWSLDARLMTQALANLLRNARQASPEGAAVEATVRASGRDLVFTVRDHGKGIAAAERERIFEPFHTKRIRGTGLGLAIARRVARLHGGDVTAGTHPDGGAVFTVTLHPGPNEEV